MKIETWNGYKIRFIEVNGEWWAVLMDIANALGLKTKDLTRRLGDEVVSNHHVKDSLNRMQVASIVSEFGIYEAIFSSRKPEAKQFKRWVFEVIKQLRQSSGLESYELFRLTDKKNQNELMATLKESLNEPTKVDYIKANAIANKAISNMFGHEKMIKKEDMTPDELAKRESVLRDVIDLMITNDKYDLGLSVSKTIYNSTEKPKNRVIYRHSVKEGANINE